MEKKHRQWYYLQSRGMRKRAFRFGDFRRVQPLSRAFGFERGLPVDRFYIERFLSEHAADIRGRVLEIGDNQYTLQFGGERVVQSDIINLTATNPATTIIADLTDAGQIPSGTFDCFIFTQTLQFIYEIRAAMKTIHRILKPGGVLLASFPVISQICRYDMDRWGDYRRFTSASVERLLSEFFPPHRVQVSAAGNVLTALCLMHGLAAE